MRKIRDLLKRRDGFTLLELLMVVIIVGILAALALPVYTGMVERARSAEAVTMLGTIKTAMEVYWLQGNTYVGTTIVPGGNTGTIGIDIPADNSTLWNYILGSTDADTFAVTATRSTLSRGDGTTIRLQYRHSTHAAVWDGTHPGVPRFAG